MNMLIVEDDTVIADAIGITLSQAGYHHVHTKTIEEALNELNHNHVDAVLLDINLPDGDGTRLTRLIRKSYLPPRFWSFPAIAGWMTASPPWAQGQMAIWPNPLTDMNCWPIWKRSSGGQMAMPLPLSRPGI